MTIEYDQKYLEELYLFSKCSDKKHRYQPLVTIARIIEISNHYQ